MERAEKLIREIFSAAVKAADPALAVHRNVARLKALYGEGGFSCLLVTGFGKASVQMAKTMEESLGDIIDAGVVITKYGHADRHGLEKIRVHEAGHPVPDEEGVRGTAEILELMGSADEKTLVVVLISGGGSALFVSPAAGLSLEDKQETTSLLLKAGADIRELNSVRKHLSRVKGGRLAEFIYPAATVSMILSDVIGDPLDVIASGPTAPDPATYIDALAVLGKYDLMERVPRAVAKLLDKGKEGVIPETPKEGDPLFRKVENLIIGSNRLSLDAAETAAEGLGFRARILSSEISGEARGAGKWLAQKSLEAKGRKRIGPPLCMISGGETTVRVKGTGKGGRNMELALAFAMEIEGVSGITLLSAGTDGTDGPTDAAGAVVDGTTAKRAGVRGLDPGKFLADNDSYNFFMRAGGLLVTGPTGTNVMDMQIVVIE